MKLTLNKSLLISIPVVMLMASCKKDKGPEPDNTTPAGPTYEVPTTYNYTNASVNMQSSKDRISMLGEIATYIRATHTTTQTTQPTLDAQKLKDMFVNAASQFTAANLNTCGFQLKDKTSTAYNLPTILENSYDDAAAASIVASANPTVSTASYGTKGKLISPTRAILVDAKGLEYKEQTEKGLMGAVFYYQATTILTNIATTYTTQADQEKAWDEAFGYFGVPVDFPTNTTGLKNWGSYCNSVNTAIGSNSTIMNAFLKGRAAISNNDASGRDDAKNTVIKIWEKVAAAKCIAYMKGAKSNFAQDADRHHNLSEGLGFIEAFRYNPSKTITTAQIDALLENFYDDANPANINLYDVTTTEMDNIINSLATIFTIDPNTL